MTGRWDTPQWLIDELAQDFDWDLDVCADRPNVCQHYYTGFRADGIPPMDGLEWPWKGLCWMNPPYGREIMPWVRKAISEVENGNATAVVALLPNRSDTRWYQPYIRMSEFKVEVSGRLKFGDSKNGAPFPSLIAVFGTLTPPQIYRLASYGQIYRHTLPEELGAGFPWQASVAS